jgi:8-oxo-dGTP pyrophosphatase MutT (NUDIX family)
MPAPWQVEARRTILADRWIRVHADRVRTNRGTLLDPFYVVEGWHWVCLVPWLPDGRVVCVEQYRHAAQQVCLELPAGNIDAEEEPAAAALRELTEETGYRACGPLVPLGTLWPEPARSTNRATGFAVPVDPFPGAAAPEDSEDLRLVLLTVDAVQTRLIHGVQLAFLQRALPLLASP